MILRIRDHINSAAGPMDEVHGRPFVLGRAVRMPRWQSRCLPLRSGLFVKTGESRLWLACVLMPDGTWRDDYAFMDREVFGPVFLAPEKLELYRGMGVIR